MEKYINNTKDALGNEIIFGNKYGYALDSNGVTNIIFGITKKFTPKGYVTLINLDAKRALYNHEAESYKYVKETVSVKPLKLFPI